MEPWRDLQSYASARDELLRRIVRELEADERVGAAWLSGSFGRHEADEWADYDLHVAVRDDAYAAFVADRDAMYRRIGTPILIQGDMPSDSMAEGVFQLVVYAGALEVDWNLGPLSKARRPLAYQMLVERELVPVVVPPALSEEQRRTQAQRYLTFFWAMAPIAIKFAGRTETRRAVTQIELLSGAFIALSRLARETGGPDPRLHATNRILELEIDERLPRVGAAIDPAGCLRVIRELCSEIEAMHPSLASLDVPVPTAMPGETARLLELAETVAARGAQPRRTYR